MQYVPLPIALKLEILNIPHRKDFGKMHFTHIPRRSPAIMLSIMAKYRHVMRGTSDDPTPDLFPASSLFLDFRHRSFRLANLAATSDRERKATSIHCVRTPHFAYLPSRIPPRLFSIRGMHTSYILSRTCILSRGMHTSCSLASFGKYSARSCSSRGTVTIMCCFSNTLKDRSKLHSRYTS